VTNAQGGESYHNYGLAIDFALRTPEGDVVWDMERDDNGNGQADWMEVVELAKELGFTWGGDWANFPDYPHLQMDFGLSINDLKRGKRPPETQ
jgi:peptidoglycan L-alanyl-D-glutamate endopeptidase CwlK